jgi:hypothetical protein
MFDIISKKEALSIWNEWNESGYQLRKLSASENKFRNELQLIQKRHSHLIAKNRNFEFDVKFAIDLHKLFNAKGLSTLRIMSDDGFWRYISLVIAPDIVESRHGHNPDYYFQKPNRVWLKSIWWLVYLSWQGTFELTETTLLSGKFSTDTTVAICERTGLEGTNIELYRAIIRKAYSIPKFGAMELRRVMKLNTVKSLVVEPSLSKGGLDGYVNSLFRDLNING